MVRKRSQSEKILVLAAEGFGSGKIPFAPGTFGTAAGFLWIYVLLLSGNLWIYLGGIVGGFFLSVWIGGKAEKILGAKDPGSIVIDEIVAMPLAFLPAVISTSNGIAVLGLEEYLTRNDIVLPLFAFVCFRVFDIAKPFGIARSQKLPGGWGLTMDDFLAAVAAAIPLAVYCQLQK